MQFERFLIEMTDWKNHLRRNATKSGERMIIKSMGGEPGESVDRELAPKFPVISGATVWNAPKHEIRAIVRGSFCAWHNHRDFLAISWNIWAICLRDERRPAGCLTARFTLSPSCLSFSTRRRIYSPITRSPPHPILLSQQEWKPGIFPAWMNPQRAECKFSTPVMIPVFRLVMISLHSTRLYLVLERRKNWKCVRTISGEIARIAI